MRYLLVMVLTLMMSMVAMTGAALAMDKTLPTDRGPAVGEMIPSDLGVLNQNGEPTNFANLTGENGVVLVFTRSVKWCPFCKKQLKDLINSADEIKAKGYNVVGLSYDSLDDIQRFIDDTGLNFDMLSDRKSMVIDAFELRNEEYGPKHFANGVPHPVIFIIGSDKIILAKLAEEGYRKRPPAELIAETIDGLNAAP